MSLYALLPLSSFVVNILLAIYIFFNNPKEKINRIYTLVTVSVALWSLGNILFFLSKTSYEAVISDKVGTIGSALTAVFLLHFFIIFTKHAVKKAIIIPLYLISIIILIIDLATNLLTNSAKPAPWGYAIVPGPLYGTYSIIIAVYISIGLFLCFKHYLISKSKEKINTLLLMIALGIPLLIGVFFEIMPDITGSPIIPLTPTFSTFTALVIAYAMAKYKLMKITPGMAVENILETMTDYLLVVNTDNHIVFMNKSCLKILGYSKEELAGKRLGLIFPKEMELLGKILNESNIHNYEAKITAKTNEQITVSINGSKIKGKFGSIIGYVLVMRDVRETQKLIYSLEEKTKELDKSKTALEESKRELESNIDSLEKFNKIAVGRELMIIELKKRINELEKI